MDQAEATVVAECHHKFGQLFVGDPSAQLTVQRINCRLAQGKPIDFLDCFLKFGRLEQCALDLLGVALEPFVCPEACARRSTQLPTDGALLKDNEVNSLSDEFVMVGLAWKSRCLRLALGCLENLKLR